jgi:hypothetical protein
MADVDDFTAHSNHLALLGRSCCDDRRPRRLGEESWVPRSEEKVPTFGAGQAGLPRARALCTMVVEEG